MKVCFAILAALLLPIKAVGESRRPRDVIVTLRKIDAASGREVWSYVLPRSQRPARCELYDGRVVVYLLSVTPPPDYVDDNNFSPREREVLFLDAKTGQAARAFDPRHFVYPSDDFLHAQSSQPVSVYDERSEIMLANKWRSHGLGRLPWWNDGSNRVYFFDRAHELQWTLTLPRGVYEVLASGNMLFYRQGLRDETQRHLIRLHGHMAGEQKPRWLFVLPPDLPDRVRAGAEREFRARTFEFTVGRAELFALGHGHVFALDPETGGLRWRSNLAANPVLAKLGFELESAGVRDLPEQGKLLLFTRRFFEDDALVLLDKSTRSQFVVLRTDLYGETPPVTHGGMIYCFTQEVPKRGAAPER
jgi:outer membrane protein assembly factor BamB